MEHRNHKGKLYRSRKNRIIAGICGGLAEHFEVDTTLVRIIFLVLSLIHGIGVLFYLIFWIMTPEAPDGEEGLRGESTKEFVEDIERELEALKEKIKQKRVRMDGVRGSESRSGI